MSKNYSEVITRSKEPPSRISTQNQNNAFANVDSSPGRSESNQRAQSKVSFYEKEPTVIMSTDLANNLVKQSSKLLSDHIRTSKNMSRSSSHRRNAGVVIFEKAEVQTATEVLTDRSSRKIVFSDKSRENTNKVELMTQNTQQRDIVTLVEEAKSRPTSSMEVNIKFQR